jgi:fatty-acyl-CoA synthase
LKRVKLSDIARGLLRAAPDVVNLNWRLLKYAALRPDSKQSIGRAIEDWARIAPQRVALRFDDRSWTYAEFNAWANRLAATFTAHGVKHGDAVAILMENRPEALACVAATVKLGAVAGMLNHNQRGEALAHSIKLIKPKLLVLGAECREAIETTPCVPGRMQGVAFFWSGEKTAAAPEGYFDLDKESARKSAANRPSTAKIAASTPCYYIFTSGTTGMPKASVMTHYRWLALLTGAGAALRLRPDDVFYCCLPLYHNNALTVSWGAALSAGATLALDRKFSASKFWDRVRHYDATAFCYIGELLRYLLNTPPTERDREHRVRLIVGNGLRPDIWEAFEQRFGIERIHEFYGASEANVGFVNAFGLRQTAGFTYMPYAIVEFDAEREQPVRDRRGFMKKIGKGGVGLLISEVTERRPFDGYTDSAASEKKLLRNVFKKNDCWFNSGDLVRDQGWWHIQFVDRVGDTFRWKGENVATNEVENALATVAGIEHGAVYGVTVPGADGRAGMAALTLKDGAEFNGARLARALQDALPAYAVPQFLRIQARQETTGTFKYRKVELKEAGFDPARVAEPLYVLLDRERGYETLTPEVFASIQRGEVRL